MKATLAALAVALPSLVMAGPTTAPARPAQSGGETAAMRKQEARSMSKVPAASTLTASSLRNRIRVALNAPLSEVWALVGDHTRYPEYSAGLERVEVKRNSNGTIKEYVCHFKPQQEGGEGVSHRERIRWYQPNRGYASISEEPNAFGLTNSLTLVTLEPSKEGTIMTWEQYYEAGDLDMNRAAFDQALADIAERLVARFGGRLAERYVEGPR